MLEEGNDVLRSDYKYYLGGQNETRLGSVITRFTVGGSGFPSSRSGCRVGANIFYEPRSSGRRGWLSRLTTGSPSVRMIQPK